MRRGVRMRLRGAAQGRRRTPSRRAWSGGTKNATATR